MKLIEKNYILLLVVASFFINILFSYISQNLITSADFPYLDDLQKTGLPKFIYSFANFDGAIYLKIAKSGYLPLTQAFFPLYPLLIWMTHIILPGPALTAGLIISGVSFFRAFILLKKILLKIASKSSLWWTILFLLTFPTSFYFQSVYTESLFLFIFLCGFWNIMKKNWLIAIICGVGLGLTRFIGLFIIIPYLGVLLQQIYDENNKITIPILINYFLKNKIAILVLVSPLLGFILYAGYLQESLGDPLAFFHLQPISNAGRSTNLILFPQVMYRYLKIFLTAQLNFQYFVAVVEFVTFSGVLAVLSYDLWKIYKRKYTHLLTRLGLNIFSIVNLLLPTFTGTFTSLPRYVLVSLSFFIALGALKNKSIKLSLLLIFTMLHIVLLMFFIQGYFVS